MSCECLAASCNWAQPKCFPKHWAVRHVLKQLGLSQSATPATQNDMTTCLETFEKERFCSFPHRHGDAAGKPETRDETHGCRKTSISCETSSNFDIFYTLSNRLECHKVPRLPRKMTWQPSWKPSKRRGFAASPINTATPQENQRLETRHVGAHFVRDFLQCWHFRRVIQQVGMSQNTTPATQNNMTTCLETFEKERFCSFPHRHGDATGKAETRDKTSKNIKTSISCETSSTLDTC